MSLLEKLLSFSNSLIGRILRFAVSLGLVAWMASQVDWGRWGTLQGKFSWTLVILALVFAAAAYPLCAWRWWVLLRAQGVAMDFGSAHRIVWIGQFYNAFLPGGVGGDAARIGHAFALSPQHKVAIAAATVIDRIAGFGTLLIFAPLALISHTAGHALQWAGLPLSLWIAGAALGFVLVSAVAIRLAPSRLPVLWRTALEQARRTPGTNGLAVLLSLAVWFLDFASGWLLAESLGLDIGFGAIVFALVVAYLSTLLPISIGGHGLRESALMVSLAALRPEATPDDFSGLALLFLATTLFCSLLGGVALLSGSMRRAEP